jgi:hypothetical protein
MIGSPGCRIFVLGVVVNHAGMAYQQSSERVTAEPGLRWPSYFAVAVAVAVLAWDMYGA